MIMNIGPEKELAYFKHRVRRLAYPFFTGLSNWYLDILPQSVGLRKQFPHLTWVGRKVDKNLSLALPASEIDHLGSEEKD